MDEFASIDFPRLYSRIEELFGLSGFGEPRVIHGGRRCLNVRLENASGAFFLKRYRQTVTETVHEVKYAEKFFHDHGIPVILPLMDIHGRSAFWFDGNWFSLFPFVKGAMPRTPLSPITLASLGRLLGRAHTFAHPFTDTGFSPLRLWDWRKFYPQFAELQDVWKRMSRRTPAAQAAIQLLEQKEKIIRNHTLRPQSVRLPFDTLLHGDFIFSNIFIDDKGEVSHLYDFEGARRGPRAFELARSIFINCFDEGWGSEQMGRAKIFVAAYCQESDIRLNELVEGVRTYLATMTYLTWIESEILIWGRDCSDVLASHQRRVDHFFDDWEAFCRELLA